MAPPKTNKYTFLAAVVGAKFNYEPVRKEDKREVEEAEKALEKSKQALAEVKDYNGKCQRTLRAAIAFDHLSKSVIHTYQMGAAKGAAVMKKRGDEVFKELDTECEEIDTKWRDSVKELNAFKVAYDDALDKHRDLEAECNRLQDELNKRAQQQVQLESEHSQLMRDHEQLKDGKAQLQLDKSQLEDEKKKLLHHHEKLKREHERLQSDHAEPWRTVRMHKRTRRLRDFAEQQQQRRQLEKSITELFKFTAKFLGGPNFEKNQNDALQQLRKNMKTWDTSAIADPNGSFTTFVRVLCIAQNELLLGIDQVKLFLSQRTQHMSAMGKDLEDLASDRDDWKAEYAELEKFLDAKEESFAGAKEALKEANRKLQELADTNKELEDTMKEFELTNKVLKDTSKVLEDMNKAFKVANEILTEDLSSKMQDIEVMAGLLGLGDASLRGSDIEREGQGE
ncbi:hypothetical protein P171DRAFT_485150 [Karstenula rhodostoma CBS 690.94]|uniref:Uncharacterized protein n=1 Tax=Karstenula rhodostoma CBS 690.94 TaxID=1392251 RepID=A0A9P4PJ23_9PLEO|nr:hypothetical protein P171DRAFT_485150 [Karstenula rhodostoma CBS 690.94]